MLVSGPAASVSSRGLAMPEEEDASLADASELESMASEIGGASFQIFETE